VGKVEIYFTFRTTNVEPPDGRTPTVMQRASYVIPSPIQDADKNAAG
jgi:hypothetical protein